VAGRLSKLLGGSTSLLVLSVTLLLAFIGLFYADAKVKESARRLHILTINTEHILNADRAATAAVRMAAGLQDDRYVLNYQDIQDSKKARLAETLKSLENEKIRQALKSMEDIQGDIEDTETEAIELIDAEKWDDALELVTEPVFGRNKAIYRSQLSTALREIIQANQKQVDQSNQLALILQIGVLASFLVLSVVGFLSLRRHSELAASLEDANANLEQRVRDGTEEIKAKQAQLQIALENMPGGMFMIDKDLKFQIFNKQYTEIFSIPDSAIRVGGALTDAVRVRAERGDYGPGDVDELVQQRLQGYTDRGTFRSEEILPGGQVIEFLRSPTDEGGIVAVATDITERKRAEKALQDSERRFKTVLANMTDGIYMLDADQNYALFNDQYLSLVELPDGAVTVGGPVEAAIRGHAARGDYGPGEIDEIVRVRLQTLANSDVVQAELSIDNGRRILDLRKAATADGSAVVIVTDITAGKTAEEVLRESEARFQAVLDNMPAAVYLRDNDGRYILINAAYREIYDVTDDEIFGKTLHELLPPGKAQEFENQDREVIKSGRIAEYETDLIQDGTPQVLTTIKFPIRNLQGNIEAVGGVDLDITERKRAEEAMRRQTQLIQLLHKIAVSANQSEDIEEALQDCLRAICAYTSWPIGHVFHCRPAAPDTLVSTGIWHVDDPDHFVAFREISDGISFERGIGLPGRVLETGSSAWIADVTKDPNFPRAKLAEDIGVRAAFAVPVLVGNKVTSVMEFFSAEAVDPEESLLSVLDNIGTQVGRVVERKQAEELITNAHELITDSISYASRIQRSVLPDAELLQSVFADHMVIWEPKDVVGGDVYLYRKCDYGHLLLLVDCTGHGVPGAFMTMIVTGALDQALIDVPDGNPAALLQRINQLVKIVLGQEGDDGESDDGFECGLCRIDDVAGEITYAGARFELWCVKGKAMTVIKGDKTGIGYRRTAMAHSFTNHVLAMKKGVAYYMTSDGLIDQVGGAKRRAFGKRRLKGAILDYSRMKMANQGIHILRAFKEYQHDEERRDDISLIAFKPKT